MRTQSKVTQIGLDVHRNFSLASLQDDSGQVIARERLEHADRPELRKRMAAWPVGTPVIVNRPWESVRTSVSPPATKALCWRVGVRATSREDVTSATRTCRWRTST